MIETPIIVALIVACPPTLISLLSFIKSKQNSLAIQDVHLSINSRMDELLSAARSASKSEGVELGRAEVNRGTKPPGKK